MGLGKIPQAHLNPCLEGSGGEVAWSDEEWLLAKEKRARTDIGRCNKTPPFLREGGYGEQ